MSHLPPLRASESAGTEAGRLVFLEEVYAHTSAMASDTARTDWASCSSVMQ